jgi:hypothetical protein
MNSEIILTRYLYNKSNVLLSLQQSFDIKDYDSELYWTYEMYYSGFEEEIIKYLLDIMENKYKNHPKLNSYIRKKYTDIKSENNNTLPATIIKNLSMKDPEKPETTKPRFIVIKDEQIEKYKTVEPKDIWKHLQIVCEKPLYSEKMTKKKEEKLLQIFREKWLYYASRSPIWQKRIIEYNGKIDGRKKTVEFINDDEYELFHDKFNYEPDEQPLELQKNCMGILYGNIE